MEKIEELLADVNKEGEDPFVDTETETPSDSPDENKPDEKEAPAEGDVPAEDNIPFHKHPRWIERENELKELRETNEATARELEELRKMQEEAASKIHTSTDIPDWFVELYGENEAAWQKYSEHSKVEREALKRELLAEQENAKRAEVEEAKKWEKWVDDEIAALKEEGNEFDTNKLSKIMLDYSPTDTDGNLDFKKGLEIYKALEKAPQDDTKSKARKELADTTTGSPKGDPPKKDYMTPSDLRHKSWGSL